LVFNTSVMNSEPETRHTLDDLSALTDLSLRTIRYYIQQGLVDRPIGEKRGAYYTARHLEQILTIRKWQAAGVSLDRIREILQEPPSGLLPPPRPRGPGTVEVWSHIVIADGVELTLEPGRAGLSPEAVRALARGVMALYQQIRDDETKLPQHSAEENRDEQS
jgi:DNA-binding transcriptional MerR regulator